MDKWYIVFVLGMAASVTATLLVKIFIKLFTKIQEWLKDKSKKLQKRFSKIVDSTSETTTLLMFFDRIRYKVVLNYLFLLLVGILFISILLILIGTSNLFKSGAFIMLIVSSTLFFFIVTIKIIQITMLNNAERIFKELLIKKKKMPLFETKVLWK